MEQENLNVQIRGVCDIFDTYGEMAVETGIVDGNKPTRYRTYEELIASSDMMPLSSLRLIIGTRRWPLLLHARESMCMSRNL